MTHKHTSGILTFHAEEGRQLLDIQAAMLTDSDTISAREGYSVQETQFLKYLASKGHIGGTA